MTQDRTNIHHFDLCPAPDALNTRTSASTAKAPVDRKPAHVVFQSYGNTWDTAKISFIGLAHHYLFKNLILLSSCFCTSSKVDMGTFVEQSTTYNHTHTPV